MKINDYLNDFTNHLTEAIEIANNTDLSPCNKKIKNILQKPNKFLRNYRKC